MGAPTASSSSASRWPLLIVAAFALFAGFIGFMVQRAMRSSVELVSPDYYQQELRYQQRLESAQRTRALPAPVRIEHEAVAQRLRLQLPPELAGPVQGELQFFRPSNQALDFTVPFRPSGTPAVQLLSTRRLQPGFWRLRLRFRAGGQAYFVEKNISLAP